MKTIRKIISEELSTHTIFQRYAQMHLELENLVSLCRLLQNKLRRALKRKEELTNGSFEIRHFADEILSVFRKTFEEENLGASEKAPKKNRNISPPKVNPFTMKNL